MNRRTIILLGIVLLVLLALLAFYFYLAGGQAGRDGAEGGEGATGAVGLIHVRTIYTADGENLRRPTGIGAATNGDFYVTLKDDARVIRFDRRGDFVAKWGERGIGQGQLLSPLAVAANDLADQVYVIDRARLRILCYNTEGAFLWEQALLNPVGITLLDDDVVVTTFGPIVRMTAEGETISETGGRGFASGEFDYPRSAVQVPETEDLIVADTNNTRIQRVQLTGEATATVSWTTGEPPRFQDDPLTLFGLPTGITLDERGRVVVLDGFRHTISVLDADTGAVLHSFTDLEGDGPGRFTLPTGIAHLGGDYFAVTDTYNDRVQIIRLLLPGEDTFFARRPWVVYLLPLLLLPLLLPLFRRRVYVTREALEAAMADENLRLLAGAFKKLHVLPEVAEAYADVVEHDVKIAPFLAAVGDPATEDGPDELHRLATAASRSGLRALVVPRRLVICGEAAQAEAMDELASARVRDYAWVLSEYRMS